jgi:hypothetical protein
MAIIDGALVDVSTVEDLARFLPSSRVPIKTIHIRETHHEIPVFRTVIKDKTVLDERILRAGALQTQFAKLALRAGYKDKFLPYCIRRAHGQAIDGKTSPTLLKCSADKSMFSRLSFICGTASPYGLLQRRFLSTLPGLLFEH